MDNSIRILNDCPNIDWFTEYLNEAFQSTLKTYPIE